jgi:hypothetical protein
VSMSVLATETNTMQDHWQKHRHMVRENVHMHRAQMMIELETAGNVRLEGGTSSKAWHRGCSERIRSCFCPADTAHLGWDSMEVVRVAHIHNRGLRSRWQAALDADDDPPRFEHLLWFEPPSMPGELHRVLEHGFRQPKEYARCASCCS